MKQTTKTTGSIIKTQDLVLTALMTAITCILAPFVIPLPFSPVPLSIATLILYISVFILGFKRAATSCIIYLLLGLVGLPVFSGFAGGFGKLAGPTGGYLIGYLFLTIIAGIFTDSFPGKRLLSLVGLVLGTAVMYLFGTVWLSFQLNLSFMEGLAAGVLPYLPGDTAKILLALILAPALKRRISSAAR